MYVFGDADKRAPIPTGSDGDSETTTSDWAITSQVPAVGKSPENTDTALDAVTFDASVIRLSTSTVYPSCEELDGTTAEPKYMPPDPMVNVPLTFAVVTFKHVALAVVVTSDGAVKQHVTFA